MAENTEIPTTTEAKGPFSITEEMAKLKTSISECKQRLSKTDSRRVRRLRDRFPWRRLFFTAALTGLALNLIPSERNISHQTVLAADKLPQTTESIQEQPNTAFVFITGKDSGDSPLQGAQDLAQSFFNTVQEITGKSLANERLLHKTTLIIGPDPIDAGRDGDDDRTDKTDGLSTAELNTLVEKRFKELVQLANDGVIDEIVLVMFNHGDIDSKSLDYKGMMMADNPHETVRLYEKTIINGLAGKPKDCQVVILLDSCHSGALRTGELNPADLGKTTYFASAQAHQLASKYESLSLHYMMPSVQKGASWGQSFREAAQIVVENEWPEQHPIMQQSGKQTYTETSEDQSIPKDTAANIGLIGSVEQTGTIINSDNQIIFTDTIRNPTEKTITYTVSTGDLSIIAPEQIVLEPHTKNSFAITVENVTASDFITNMLSLSSHTGQNLKLVNLKLPDGMIEALQFSPEENPGSYVYDEKTEEYTVTIPVTNTGVLPADLHAQYFHQEDNLGLGLHDLENIPIEPGQVSYVKIKVSKTHWPPDINLCLSLAEQELKCYQHITYPDEPEKQEKFSVYLPMVFR